MGTVLTILSWAGIILLALVTVILEDLMFLFMLTPYMPPTWDLTGDLFWVLTVPLAQFMALAVTGTLAWFLGLKYLPRLITFWLIWTVGRGVFLTLLGNPPGDVMVYLLWIALWCALIGLFAQLVVKDRRMKAA